MIQATGTVTPNETQLAHVRPIARGRVEHVYVRLGDRVRAGQTLLLYDNAELGEAIGQYLSALSALEKANAEAQIARRSVERAQALVDIGALARAEFDRRTAEQANALASVESQKSEAAKIEEKLHRFGMSEEEVQKLNPREGAGSHREASHTKVIAPFDGIVIQFDAVEGENVGPDDIVFAIADLSALWVLADVYEKDIPAIQKDQIASILTDAYPGEVFHGTISYLSHFLDPKTRTAKVRCEVPNYDGRLKLDMFVTVQLPAPAGRQALMVPATAIQQINDRPTVFVQTGENEFEPRHVELGVKSDGWVEVPVGVKEADVVATSGSFYLKSSLLRSEIGGEH
jgi:cobalt-zinc-cadmium efflux system membrane fusion protein